MEKYIVSGEFSSSSLEVQGYSLIEVGKGKAKSENFREMSEVSFDPEKLLDALEDRGNVYAYKKKGIVKALYIVRWSGNRYSCNECFYAPDIEDEPVKDLMDAQMAFLISHNSLNLSKDERPVFKNAMGAAFAALYGVIFSQSLGNMTGYLIGIPMGISMGLCLQNKTYHYDLTEA